MFGLRGRLNMTVTVRSPNPDLHSGMHGGICVSRYVQIVTSETTLVLMGALSLSLLSTLRESLAP